MSKDKAHLRQELPKVSRRSFLKTSGGIVALSVLPVATLSQPLSAITQPGARIGQRIDGYAKVTGQKVFARDFNARDMAGWPDTQWYALYIRAIRTDQPFSFVDLSILPSDAFPTRTIYGDQVASGINAPDLKFARDLMLDQEIELSSDATAENFDRPGGLLYDLVVQRGNRPDFLGQAVALLLFSSQSSYNKALKLLQFQDELIQKYDGPIEPQEDDDFTPTTLYVRVANPTGGPDLISFASAESTSDYLAEAPKYQAVIDDYINDTPDLITHEFSSDMQAMDPMFMEPETGLAWYDRRNQRLSVVLGTQSPDGDVENIAKMYADENSPFDVSEVVLTSCYPGGGFGGRDGSPFTLMTVLAAAYTDGAPVRLAHDRFDQFRIGLKRHGCKLTGEVAVMPDQKIKVINMGMVFDGGGRKNLSPYVAQLAGLCAGGSYAVPMNNIASKAIHTVNISGGSQRGFGGPQAFFAIETALDQVARDQGWDPIDFRRTNLLTQGSQTVVGGPVGEEIRLPELLDIAQNHPVWTERASVKAQFEAEGLMYGTGIAMSLQAYGTSGDGVIGGVYLDNAGRISVRSNAVDMGNGSATTLAAVVAESLGSVAQSATMGDYELFPQMGMVDDWGGSWTDPKWTAKSVGSSSACLTAFHQVHVVKNAARALFLQSILPAARILWGTPNLPEGATKWEDGLLTVPGTGLPVLSMPRIAGTVYGRGLASGTLAHAYFQETWAEADFGLSTGTAHLPLDGLTFFFGNDPTPQHFWRSNTVPTPVAAQRYSRTVFCPCLNLIGVSVQPDTGIPRVEKSVTILDAGTIHVPELVTGQSEGGLAMAIGYALLEDMPPGLPGPADGTWNLNRYHVPRLGDVPLSDKNGWNDRLQELILLPPSAANAQPPGKGIAEAVMCSVAPAISNALADATGARFTSLPITAAKIREGLSQ